MLAFLVDAALARAVVVAVVVLTSSLDVALAQGAVVVVADVLASSLDVALAQAAAAVVADGKVLVAFEADLGHWGFHVVALE